MERGTALIALVVYLATSLFVWFFTLPSIGLFESGGSTNRLAGNSLDQHLQYARKQAIERQQPITICSSSNGLSCSRSHQWQHGWIVFTDSDRDPGQINAEDQLLLAYDAKRQTATLGINAEYVRYLANGVIELN